MPIKLWDEIINPFPNFNGVTFAVWECISNFIPHFTIDAITYPCWDQLLTILVNGVPGGRRTCYKTAYGTTKPFARGAVGIIGIA